jgi:hypothetical protein
MLKLSEPELREFGIRGYVLIRNVIQPDILAAASTAIDRLVDEQRPPEGYVGHHFYWLSTLDGGPLPALFYDTPVRSLAQSLVDPGEIEIAFDQVQVALNIPPFSHRPGCHHLDGYQEGEQIPGTFTMLAAVLMTEQRIENSGNLWVWLIPDGASVCAMNCWSMIQSALHWIRMPKCLTLILSVRTVVVKDDGSVLAMGNDFCAPYVVS